MAITQEQYDSIQTGDYLVVAYSYITSHHVFNDMVKVEVKQGVVYSEHDEMCVENNNLVPHLGGKIANILHHIPKPKPDWHNAEVIEENDCYYIRNWDGRFRSSSGNLYAITEFELDGDTVNVVVPGE